CCKVRYDCKKSVCVHESRGSWEPIRCHRRCLLKTTTVNRNLRSRGTRCWGHTSNSQRCSVELHNRQASICDQVNILAVSIDRHGIRDILHLFRQGETVQQRSVIHVEHI